MNLKTINHWFESWDIFYTYFGWLLNCLNNYWVILNNTTIWIILKIHRKHQYILISDFKSSIYSKSERSNYYNAYMGSICSDIPVINSPERSNPHGSK